MPRKSYDRFNADIFPDTRGPVASVGPEQWWSGDNSPPSTISLDPAKRSEVSAHFPPPLSQRNFTQPMNTGADENKNHDQPALVTNNKAGNTVTMNDATKPAKSSTTNNNEDTADGEVTVERRDVDEKSFLLPQIRPKSSVKEKAPKFGRVTKFRHLKGTPLHKSQRFENLRGLSRSTPAETDIIQVNTLF